jgi:Domain of unknown function (DUF1902)
MSKPVIFIISAAWDQEASVWSGHCDEIPAAADAPTLDELLAKISAMALDLLPDNHPEVDPASLFLQITALREAEPAMFHDPTPDVSDRSGCSRWSRDRSSAADRATVRRIVGPKRCRSGLGVNPRDAARPIRQHRLDGRPLMVGEFVAHDSRLRFGATPSTRYGPSR